MKQVRNLEHLLVSKYISKLGFIRKFVRYWGTTTVDGIEVLNFKKEYYRSKGEISVGYSGKLSTSEAIKELQAELSGTLVEYSWPMEESAVKVAKHLGVYADLKSNKMKGVRSAWLFLNYAKEEEGVPIASASILTENLNTAIGTGFTADLVIGPKVRSGSKRRLAPKNLIPPPLHSGLDSNGNVVDAAALIAEVKASYSDLWHDGYSVTTNVREDTYQDILLKYLLLSTRIPYSIVNVKKTYTDIDIPYYTYKKVLRVDELQQVLTHKRITTPAYSFTINVSSAVITSATDIVTSILADASGPQSVLEFNKNVLKHALSYNGTSDKYAPLHPTSSALWHTSNDGNHYLRADALTGTLLTLDEKMNLLRSCLDTGYKEKPLSFWAQVLPIAIFIIALVITHNPVAASEAAALAMATAITLSALVVAVFTYAAAQLGYDGIAMAGSRFLQNIDPLVTIASVINVVAAVTNAVSAAAQEAAKEAAKTAAIENAVDLTLATTKQLFKNLFTSYTVDISVSRAAQMFSMVFNAYSSREIKDIQKKIKRNEAKLAEYQETKEQIETRHLWLDMIKMEPQLLAKDKSIYASLYDRPYEWWSTKFHTGNIQATTVNAMWKIPENNGIM